MKKINLRGISEILSEKELKNVMGGSTSSCTSAQCNNNEPCGSTENGYTMRGKCWWSSGTCYCNYMVG